MKSGSRKLQSIGISMEAAQVQRLVDYGNKRRSAMEKLCAVRESHRS